MSPASFRHRGPRLPRLALHWLPQAIWVTTTPSPILTQSPRMLGDTQVGDLMPATRGGVGVGDAGFRCEHCEICIA
jgi:hypothetical protein